MPSVRKWLTKKENINESSNTRLDIALALQQMDLRADYLAHMSRYCKIAQLMIDESRELKRPISVFELGCGDLWPLRYLYKAIVINKASVLKKYYGYDIDPQLEAFEYEDENGEYTDKAPGWFKIFNCEMILHDLTVDRFKLQPKSQDMFICTEVIEHVNKEFVEPFIRRAWQTLRTGGLAFISTPNSDGSKAKLPIDHIYEWGYEELKTLLARFFKIESHYGTFIQLPYFKLARGSRNPFNGDWPDWLVEAIQGRFDKNWQRVIFAVNYPHLANNVTWILRAK